MAGGGATRVDRIAGRANCVGFVRKLARHRPGNKIFRACITGAAAYPCSRMEITLGIILLVVLGLVLIGVEFYMPGFVLATVGIILLLTADFICLNHFGVNWAAGLFVAEVVLALLTGYVVIKTIPQTAAGKRMILSLEQRNASAVAQVPEMVGATGVAQTTLRPSGMAEIAGKRLDVVAESDMIARGSAIQVIAVEGNRIVVRKV